MSQIASLNSKLLSTGRKNTLIKSKQTITNESVDLTMILFIFGCFFVLMFIILVLNADYKNLDKYKKFSGDPEAMNFLDRLKSWFLCNQDCKLRPNITTVQGNIDSDYPSGLNNKGQCWQ